MNLAHGETFTRVAAFASGTPLSTGLGGAVGGREQQATADPGRAGGTGRDGHEHSVDHHMPPAVVKQ